MYPRTNAISSYGRVANAETNPLQQLVMLYDGAISFLRQAAADIESHDIAKKAEHVNRALDILNYLQSILDFKSGGKPAEALDKLYTVVSLKVLQASATLDAREMREAAQVLVPVRDSWSTVMRSDNYSSNSTAEVPPADLPRLGPMVLA